MKKSKDNGSSSQTAELRRQAEETLAASEVRYRRLFEAAKDGILILDADTGVVVDVNPFLAGLLGSSHEEICGKELWELGFFKDIAANKAKFRELREQRYVRYENLPLETAQGLKHNVEFVSNVYQTNHHKVIQCHVRDITERNVAERELREVNRADHSRGEEALRASEQRLRTLLESVTDYIYTVRIENGQVVETQHGPGCVAVTGYTSQEYLADQHLWLQMVHEGDRSAVLAMSEGLRAGKPQAPIEHRIIHKDGDTRWIIHTPVLQHNDQGVLVGWDGLIHDITDRKLTEELHRTVQQTAMDGFWLVDAHGHIVDVNDAYCRMIGYSREELLEMSIPDLDADEGPAEAAARIQRIIDTGNDLIEVRHRRKDGRIIDVEASVTHIGSSSKRLCAFMRDITTRKRAEQALRESENRYHTLVENIRHGITLIDRDYRVLMANAGVGKLLPKQPADLVGKQCFAEFEKRDQICPHCPGSRALATNQPAEVETEGVRDDGSRFSVRVSAFPIVGADGQAEAFIEVVEDVTERKRMEDQLRQSQKMEAVGQLASGIAHDFRNQLTVVKGYSEMLLREESIKGENRGYLEEILKAADRSSRLTGELLAFSRKQLLCPEVINLNVLIADLSKSLARMIGEDVRLSVAPAAELSSVEVDPGQFQQALANLVVNARDAMPKGGRLRIETANVELDEQFVMTHIGAAAGPHVTMTVSDTGVGMDDQTMMRVFDPFFTTKPVGQGTGLGLSMVYGFVKQSGGYIAVESKVGHGTTFRIYLPRVSEIAKPRREKMDEAPLPHGQGTVLVVEDEESIRHLLTRTLTALGYSVLSAAAPNEAIPLASGHEGPIDLLLTDVVMPGMDGIDLAKHLREARLGLRVLFMSGYTDRTLDAHGFDGIRMSLLVKPFSPQAVAEAVRQAMWANAG